MRFLRKGRFSRPRAGPVPERDSARGQPRDDFQSVFISRPLAPGLLAIQSSLPAHPSGLAHRSLKVPRWHSAAGRPREKLRRADWAPAAFVVPRLERAAVAPMTSDLQIRSRARLRSFRKVNAWQRAKPAAKGRSAPAALGQRDLTRVLTRSSARSREITLVQHGVQSLDASKRVIRERVSAPFLRPSSGVVKLRRV
jgi:hypothetical protein